MREVDDAVVEVNEEAEDDGWAVDELDGYWWRLCGVIGTTNCMGTSRARNAWYSWIVAISVALVSQRHTGARRMNTPTGCIHQRTNGSVSTQLTEALSVAAQARSIDVLTS